MSKKTRKKSSKARSGKAAVARPTTTRKTAASTSGRGTAKKTGESASKRPDSTTSKTPRQAPSKHPKQAIAPVASKTALVEGAKAPAFRLPRDGGGSVSLSDYSGERLVLFFYPRADTPGCTKEAIDFSRLASAFAQSRTAILGVSADSPKAQEAFRDKHGLTTPLVSDEKHEMLEAYGVWGEKSMYGRTFPGVLRTTVLIGADGRIARIWRQVKVDGHADEVLAAARAL